MMQTLTNTIMGILLQYVSVLNQHIRYLKLAQLYLNKDGKKYREN